MTTKVISELWRSCGKLGEMPKQWHRVALFPIHKKDCGKKAENYRPIALLSHVRKTVEKAVDSAIRYCVELFPLQCGFRRDTGVEQAILGLLEAQSTVHRFIAVLDLKGAYPSVPRAQLVQVISKRIPSHLTKMVAVTLRADKISTVGDVSRSQRFLREGCRRDHRCRLPSLIFTLILWDGC